MLARQREWVNSIWQDRVEFLSLLCCESANAQTSGVRRFPAAADSQSVDLPVTISSDDEAETQHFVISAGSAVSLSDDCVICNLETDQRVLTERQLIEYKKLVASPGDEQLVVTHPAWSLEVARHHFSTCAPGGWLADPIINMYMAMLQGRDTRWLAQPHLRKPRVLYMTSHFITKMCQEAGGYDYTKVRRWTRPQKLRRIGVLQYNGIRDVDKVVAPVHLGTHWTCIVGNFRDRRLEYYDSLGSKSLGKEGRRSVDAFKRWIEDDWMDKRCKPQGGERSQVPLAFKASAFTEVINPPDTPRQHNCCDCGVFTAMCANFVGADKAFDYDQAAVSSFFRPMIALECRQMRLRAALTDGAECVKPSTAESRRLQV